MEPAQSKIPHHEVQSRNPTISIRAVQFPFFIQTPHGFNIFSDVRGSKLLDQIPDIAKPGSAYHDISRELGTVLENDAILREVWDLRVALKLDFTVDDELAAAMVWGG